MVRRSAAVRAEVERQAQLLHDELARLTAVLESLNVTDEEDDDDRGL